MSDDALDAMIESQQEPEDTVPADIDMGKFEGGEPCEDTLPDTQPEEPDAEMPPVADVTPSTAWESALRHCKQPFITNSPARRGAPVRE